MLSRRSLMRWPCKYVYRNIKDNHEGIIFLRNVYRCSGTIRTICDGSLLCISASRDHLTGKQESNVEYLSLIYSKTSRSPRHIERIFLNLLGLRVSGDRLLSSRDLHYPRLKTLYLGWNKLRTLDSDLFRYTPNLIFIGRERRGRREINIIASSEMKS